ncbi:MAG: DUF5107 domain-containing protein [Spirochaetes bacterium]|jgi:tetratricopeptide (TPR) repeat protein|nr:DUF5107 domain-containing protein [Spirochaetota bacterium]
MRRAERSSVDGSHAQAWNETITIPTYSVAEPDHNPMFLEKRVYQGSSGAVYPYRMTHGVADEPRPQSYDAVFLENRYLKIMILPELGGRVQMALDKTNDYHFVYYNRVIKPALVGLAGPWISGGIEFNWPQHHRPSTFAPTEYEVRHGEDGSATVWISEWEKMFRTRSAAGFRLYPDRAVLEINGRVYNPTPVTQTFLWWANPAVSVNDDYQAVFPPDVTAVFDHGKRDLSRFPIATGEYYKVDYSRGVDISWYKNVPVPTSYMAYHSDYDFVGGYDHGRQAGILHVADHHVSPGKKMWTWGTADFGQAWERNLTDDDGPYVELMTGVYTDNQPDFSWLEPGEEKRFTQYFFPFKSAMPVKAASERVVLAVDPDSHPGHAVVHLYATEALAATVRIERDGVVEAERELRLSPVAGESWTIKNLKHPEACTFRVCDTAGAELLRYPAAGDGELPPAKPAEAAPPPHRIAATEELFLWGRHIEQYRHATFSPEPYYYEVLKRDARHSGANNALGLRRLKQGDFPAAEELFRTACARLLERNPNPYGGEPLFNLGLALWHRRQELEAYDWFSRSAWNMPLRAESSFFLARIDASRSKLEQALARLETALAGNPAHFRASHLRTVILRKLGRSTEAEERSRENLERFPVNHLAETERMLQAWPGEWPRHLSAKPHLLCEILFSYGHSGFREDAIELVNRYMEEADHLDPLPLYVKAMYQQELGKLAAAEQSVSAAEACARGASFPNQLEMIPVLLAAREIAPAPMAAYELGNYYFATGAHARAHEQWEYAAEAAPSFPTAHRNLALSHYNKRDDPVEAHRELELALSLAPQDAEILLEMDVLMRRMGRRPAERLTLLDRHSDAVFTRDDLTVSYVELLNLTGRSDQALEILSTHRFHPWEGGEGKVPEQYKRTLIQLAQADLDAGRPRDAVERLEAARVYPRNLGEGKLPTAEADNEIDFWLSCAHAFLDDEPSREAALRAAARGEEAPEMSFYYNDRPADAIFYQALAWRLLGNETNARRLLHRLRDYGETHLDDAIQIDYFAVSLPDFLVFEEDLDERNRRFCLYLWALGEWGLGRPEAAGRNLRAVLDTDPGHAGAHFAAALVRSCTTVEDTTTAAFLREATTPRG